MKLSLIGDLQGDRRKLYVILSFFLVLFLLFSQLTRIKSRIVKGFDIFNKNDMNIFSTYELKMRHKLGWEIIDYYEFVKRNTPENSKILIPPQGFPWPMSGNAAYSRYFLYPRHLISGKEKEPGVDLKKENIKYVLIIWGESKQLQYDFTHGWPKFSLPAKRIIYKKPTNQILNYDKVVLEKDFKQADIQKEWWGLIEVDLDRL